MGRQRYALIPWVIADVLILSYLTGVFIYPIWRLNKAINANQLPLSSTDRTVRLRKIAFRSCVGTGILVCVSTANAVAQIVLNGEPAWQSLNSNNIETLLTIVMLQWITSTDHRKLATCDHDQFFSLPSRNSQNFTASIGSAKSRESKIPDVGAEIDEDVMMDILHALPKKNSQHGHDRDPSWKSETLTATNSLQEQNPSSRISPGTSGGKTTKVAFVLPTKEEIEAYSQASPRASCVSDETDSTIDEENEHSHASFSEPQWHGQPTKAVAVEYLPDGSRSPKTRIHSFSAPRRRQRSIDAIVLENQ
jgi:hypothetical protein